MLLSKISVLAVRSSCRIPVRMLETGTAGPPIVVVLGSTATGKSKLAIDLALKFSGEVISADSMQVYEGMDLLSNKVTTEESKGILHHMISVVKPTAQFDIRAYSDMAKPVLDGLLEKRKMPIIVGGTNYYIESLLWNNLIRKSTADDFEPPEKMQKVSSDVDELTGTESTKKVLKSLRELPSNLMNDEVLFEYSNVELHEALMEVDTERAEKLHFNDRRKVIRSLQVFVQTGKLHSEWIRKQLEDEKNSAASSAVSPLGGSLRYSNIVFLWIDAPLEVLHARINDRVDQMVGLGLREEIHEYWKSWIQPVALLENYTKGQLQSIGYKEFREYLALDESERGSQVGEEAFKKGVEELKIVTRQYARKQLKWIRQRFLRPSRRSVPPVYGLNGSERDPESWDKNVTSVASAIVEAVINSDFSAQVLKDTQVEVESEPAVDDMKRRVCEVCQKTVMGTKQWNAHMNSYKHKKTMSYKAKEKLKTESNKNME